MSFGNNNTGGDTNDRAISEEDMLSMCINSFIFLCFHNSKKKCRFVNRVKAAQIIEENGNLKQNNSIMWTRVCICTTFKLYFSHARHLYVSSLDF